MSVDITRPIEGLSLRLIDLAGKGELTLRFDRTSPSRHGVFTARLRVSGGTVFTSSSEDLSSAIEGAFVQAADAREDRCALSTLCSVCGLPQFSSPGGVTCPKGHGGADGVEPE